MFGNSSRAGQTRIIGILYLLLLGFSCSSNDKDLISAVNVPPVILSVTATPDTLAFGERSTVLCRAADEDGDPISFTWSAAAGGFLGSRTDSTIVWSPSDGLEGQVTLTVVARDRTRASEPATIDMFVVGDTGSLQGSVVDRSTNLPLASVVISAGDRNTQTSAEGLYSISTIPAGSYTFTADLEGYSQFGRTIEIRTGQNTLDVTLTPVASIGTVTGHVTNSMGASLSGATCRIGDRTVSTDGTGVYVFADILRESHILQITRSGYLFSSQSITLDSTELQVDVVLDAAPPTRPTNVTAEKSGRNITITWPASPEDTVTEYQVFQRIDREGTMAIPGARVASSNRQYVLVGETDHRYRFRISAFNFESEESGTSNESNMLVLTDLTVQVPIPAGPVIMGATPDEWEGEEDWGTEDHPANPIEVASFLIDATEVTNLQYRAYLYEARSTGAVTVDVDGERNGIYAGEIRLLNFGASKLRLDGGTQEFTIVSGFENHPVVGVSWFGARAYAEHFGLRLPTELEWEKAARGSGTEWGSYPNTAVGYGTLYPWGTENPELSRVNFGNRASGTLLVTSLEPGATIHWSAPIYHLAGNAWEWCEDWLSAYQDPHSPPTTGDLRVLRGGSWLDSAERLRSGARFAVDPSVGTVATGFRCVVNSR